MKNIFSVYADNASKYCVAASNQSNETFNNIICHKFPKNKSYSTSGHIRVASAVLNKNDGDSYLLNVKKSLGLTICTSLKKFCMVTDKNRIKNSIESKSIKKKNVVELNYLCNETI